ncbi:MAG: DUF3048 C-terminal domain-containing protein [Eubacteriales bacterium]|nr:DUF3048 C-terminal domain-containing protein [Eubacteriales bacterium]
MKKIVCLLLVCALIIGMAAPAMAASKVKPNSYSLPLEGTVLQNNEDRNITPKTPAERNPIIPGESPTTGLAWEGTYLPMIVQISDAMGTVKVNGKSVKSAGIGSGAPWGGQYADIVYEGILYRTGATRLSFLFSDSFAENQPTSAGPVRSARIGHVLLREEWQSGLVFAGGPRATENNIAQMFAELGASEKGVVFDLVHSNKWDDYKNRVSSKNKSGPYGPDNLNVDVVALRNQIPADYVAQPHAFLFSDVSPYTDGYEFAYTINLDWGDKQYISHFYYDENENLYLRYSGDAPYMTITTADIVGPDRLKEENQIQMSFSNVIIQRVPYEYTNNSKIMPVMQSVGKGNADIFIGGRYIAGYWVRESTEGPTVFYDDQGNELQFTRGKTFIAHLPPESLCTFSGIE